MGALCRERAVAFHMDAAQAVGKIPVDLRALPVDFLSLTAHKIYGPKGVGALYVRRASRPLLQPLMFGGGQEKGLRPGTLATHQIVGLGAACELAARQVALDQERLFALRERLWQGIARLEGVHLNAAGAPRVPGILNVSFEGVEGESLVTGLKELFVVRGPHAFATWPAVEELHATQHMIAYASAVVLGEKTIPGPRTWSNMKQLVGTSDDVWEPSTHPTVLP